MINQYKIEIIEWMNELNKLNYKYMHERINECMNDNECTNEWMNSELMKGMQ